MATCFSKWCSKLLKPHSYTNKSRTAPKTWAARQENGWRVEEGSRGSWSWRTEPLEAKVKGLLISYCYRWMQTSGACLPCWRCPRVRLHQPGKQTRLITPRKDGGRGTYPRTTISGTTSATAAEAQFSPFTLSSYPSAGLGSYPAVRRERSRL